MDFAYRAHSHNYRFDPIIRSLLDDDFYKHLTQQFAFINYPNTDVEFSLINRTATVRLADEIDLDELREQLDHCRTLRFTPNELIWLTGQTFYGQTGIFHKAYIDYLRTFRLPDYELERNDGQIVLRTKGGWADRTLWEILFLAIVNEMRYRAKMRLMSKSKLDIMYSRAKVKLYDKLERLASRGHLSVSDFGTRRRHSFLWQEHCVLTAAEILGDSFVGTSTCYLAMKHGFEAKGTIPHEASMVLAALSRTDEKLKQSQYELCREWQNTYRGNLLMLLPDAFGTTQFLRDAPSWIADWTGARPDSKAPIKAGEELIAWWNEQGKNPKDKLIIFSDGLDVEVNGRRNGEDIIALADHFDGRVRVGFGFGTNFTNDFLGCHPDGSEIMKPISLVCKVSEANGRPAVKLSDNYDKATGPAEEVTRYRRVFGSDGMKNVPVNV